MREYLGAKSPKSVVLLYFSILLSSELFKASPKLLEVRLTNESHYICCSDFFIFPIPEHSCCFESVYCLEGFTKHFCSEHSLQIGQVLDKITCALEMFSHCLEASSKSPLVELIDEDLFTLSELFGFK